MVRKTKEDAAITRDQLLDAAQNVFFERGVAHTSLAEVAQAAGLTRGAVYWHFENKADLLAALCERCSLPLQQSTAKIRAAYPNDVLARIRERACSVLRSVVEDESTRKIMTILLLKCEYVDEISAASNRLIERREHCLEQMVDEFRDAVAAGQIPAHVPPRQAAIGLMSLVDGLCFHWLFHPPLFALATSAEFWVNSYLNGIIASSAPIADPAVSNATEEVISAI